MHNTHKQIFEANSLEPEFVQIFLTVIVFYVPLYRKVGHLTGVELQLIIYRTYNPADADSVNIVAYSCRYFRCQG